MTDTYLLHFPDGTEYGPVDRTTLEAWHHEGRIPEDALVWPEGAPEWLAIDAVLAPSVGPAPGSAGAGSTAAAGEAASAKRGPTGGPTVSSEAARRSVAARERAPAGRSALARDHTATITPLDPAPRRPTAPVPATRPPAASGPAAPREAAPSGAAAARGAASVRTAPSGPGPAAGAGATARPAAGSTAGSTVVPRPSAPLPPEDDEPSPDTRPPGPAPQFRHAAPAAPLWSGRTRALGLLAGGVLLVLVLLAGLLAVLRPFIERRWAVAGVERHALADRRVGDDALGFVLALPPGWVALRDDNPFVITRGARLRVANPALQAFGAVQVEKAPELSGDLDREIDALLQEQLPSRPSLREAGRTDVQLGRGRGRLARTTWDEDGQPLQGALAVWADGYEYYSLDTWAPASVGDSFGAALEELLRGIEPSGKLDARVDEAAERLSVEVPELPLDSLRLLIGSRMAEGESLDGVSVDALRGVSRGIEALSPAEAEEMRRIYEKIWEPVPEAQRERLARILESVKRGSPVPAPYLQALRDVVKAGVLELPAEERARLQELSARALEKSLLLQ